MSQPTAFVLNLMDAVDLVYRAMRKLEKVGQTDEAVSLSLDSILSQTIYQFRNKAVVFAPEQRIDYDRLVKFVS